MLSVSQKENIAATALAAPPQDNRDHLAARAICSEIRQALHGILTHAVNGARDLRDGLPWSRDLQQFELVSMKHARSLARFPISTADERLGALVHRARASFVAFRETVRREIIGAIGSTTNDAAYDLALEKVNGRSVLADESLKFVEQALTQYSPQFPAISRNHNQCPRFFRETARSREVGAKIAEHEFHSNQDNPNLGTYVKDNRGLS